MRTDTVHTLYLSPDGEVRWVVDESGVRSDEEEEGKRLDEEQAYIGAALVGAHRSAQGLLAIAPEGPVQTTVLRDERPFHVVTDARFARVDRALDRLFRTSGLQGSAELTTEEDAVRLHMRFDFRRPTEARDTPALALLEEFEDFRFVLTRGHFVAGGGFEVPDRSRAVLSRESMARLQTAMEAQQTLELVLTWTTAR